MSRGKLRVALGLTGFKISLNSLGLYERGERSPDIDTLLKIAEILGSDHFQVDDNLRIEFRKNGRARPVLLPQQLRLDFDAGGGVNVRIEPTGEGLLVRKIVASS